MTKTVSNHSKIKDFLDKYVIMVTRKGAKKNENFRQRVKYTN